MRPMSAKGQFMFAAAAVDFCFQSIERECAESRAGNTVGIGVPSFPGQHKNVTRNKKRCVASFTAKGSKRKSRVNTSEAGQKRK